MADYLNYQQGNKFKLQIGTRSHGTRDGYLWASLCVPPKDFAGEGMTPLRQAAFRTVICFDTWRFIRAVRRGFSSSDGRTLSCVSSDEARSIYIYQCGCVAMRLADRLDIRVTPCLEHGTRDLSFL